MQRYIEKNAVTLIVTLNYLRKYYIPLHRLLHLPLHLPRYIYPVYAKYAVTPTVSVMIVTAC